MALKLTPPGGERTFDAALTVVFGLFICVRATPLWPQPVSYPAPVVALAGMILTIAGAGLWRRQAWARWPVIALMLMLAGLAGMKNLTDGIGFWGIVGPVALLWHAWDVFRHFSPEALAASDPANDGPMISLVLLLRRPRHLEATLVARYAEQVWNTPFVAPSARDSADESPDQPLGPWVMGQSPIFMVSAPDGMFAVHNHNRPYFDRPQEAAEEVHELRQRKIILENRGWLAVDLMQLSDPNATRESAYPAIARFIAELAGPDCQAIFQPATARLNPWDDTLEAKLRSGQVAEVFEEPTLVPVIQVPDDDPRMQAAVAEARQRWPEFVAAFNAQDAENFSVKAPVSAGGNTEFIWVQVEAIHGDQVSGTLGNEPVDLGDLREGSRVTVAADEVSDWAFLRGEEHTGLFSLKAIQAIQAERNQEARPTESKPDA